MNNWVKSRKRAGLLAIAAVLGLGAWWMSRFADPAPWTEAEMNMLRSLWIGSLPPLPADPTNAVADDPRAAKLGQALFFDTRFSANGGVSCATCHQPGRQFTDGRALGEAIGTSARNTRSIVGAAHSPWQYWDGRKDSLWSQALSPLEDPNEHAGNRMQYVRLIVSDPGYRSAYEALFGTLPDLSDEARFPEAAAPVADPALNAAWQAMAPEDREVVNTIFVNMGKAIAAYERLLMPGPSRFDAYVQALLDGDEAPEGAALSEDEIRGLRLFIGKANCTQCHNGPLLTNNEFHNTAVITFSGKIPDKGRVAGIRKLQADPFNCLSAFSDDAAKNCSELRFARTGPDLIGAVRTPSLRTLDGTEPYMHAGQLVTLAEVLDHYNRAPVAMIGHNEAKPLKLGKRELRQLEAFLTTLAGPVATAPEWLAAPQESPERLSTRAEK